MKKILELMVDEFHRQKPSVEYLLRQKNVCEIERLFMASLDKKQKAEYLKLDFVIGEMIAAELDEFAEFLGNLSHI